MTQEEKLLLTKDLCTRLPYGVKCYVPVENCTMELTGKRLNYFCFHKEEYGYDYSHEFEVVLDPLNDANNNYIVKPYLRPMSSMTEEEKREYESTFDAVYDEDDYGEDADSWHYEFSIKSFDWLNKNHFDYRTDEEGKTLIEKGLAIAVTKENNPYKD